MIRYLRLYGCFLRYTLMEAMSFRGNFLLGVAVEFLWFGLMVLFYEVVYAQTPDLGGWSKHEYLVLLGTYFVLTGLIETLVMPNCAELAELVRTGKLDFALLKPVDEQFLLTTQRVDWTTFSNVCYGLGLAVYGAFGSASVPSLMDLLIYLILLASGYAFFYSVMVTLAVTAVWVVRNQSIYEQWWYVNMFSRYPGEIFEGWWARPLRWVLTYIFPVLVVVSSPAKLLASRLWEPEGVALSLAAGVGGLVISRHVFRRVLRHYRGASA
jgi:ABC-2 type transport system permease protein